MRRNKYGATRFEGFHSKLEWAVHQHLILRQKLGEISQILKQQTVLMTEAKIKAIIDFSYKDETSGDTVYVEAKGMNTASWSIKKKLWKFYGPGKLEIFKGTYQRPKLKEIVEPIKKGS